MREFSFLQFTLLLFVLLANCQLSIVNCQASSNKLSLPNSEKTIISRIKVAGNKTTKDYIVARELSLRVGDTVDRKNLDKSILESEANLINSSLFNYVKIVATDIDSIHTELFITVTERWYIWPIPVFQYADPNFNTWWQTHDFTRTNYGMNLRWLNFRGRKEELNVKIQFGYLKDFGFTYYAPYITKKRRLGGGLSVSYTQNNEFTIGTIDNRRIFYTGNHEVSRDVFNMVAFTTWRSKFFNSHQLQAAFTSTNIKDTITRITNDYFVNNQTYMQYISWAYTFRHSVLDNKDYPLNGRYIQADISWNGFPLMPDNHLMVIAFKFSYKRYFTLGKNFFYAINVKGKYTPTTDIPYYFQQGLGYSDYVRGYEYYVIDGQSMALLKSNFKFRIYQSKVYEAKALKNTGYSKSHFSAYLNFHFDGGYVVDKRYEAANPLSNTMLYGTGIGLDLVAYYDKVIRFEYSFNKQLEHGFFIHFVKPV